MRIRPGQMFNHLLGYSALMGWLGRRAISWLWVWILLCGAVSVASVVTEIFAFLLIIKVLQVSELGIAGADSVIPSVLNVSDWHPALRVLVPVAVLSISGVLTYLGKSVAVALQGRFTTRLSDEILSSLRERLGYFDRLDSLGGYSVADVVSIVTSDSLACGLALRLAANNLISIVYLIAGLGILAVLAPALLALWGVSLVLIAPVVYLINLKVLGQARLLLDLAPRRRKVVIAELQMLYGGDKAPEPDSDSIKTQYLMTMESRMRLVELSRVSLSLVFAVAVAAFLWIAQNPDARSMMNLAYLFLLFLAFRYTFHGFLGLSVLITTINRNLPSMIRVYDINQRIATSAKRNETAQRDFADNDAEIKWRIDSPKAGVQKGQFKLGQSYVVCVTQLGRANVIGQVYGMLAGRPSQVMFSKLVGSRPIWVTQTVAASKFSTTQPAWICELLEIEGSNSASVAADHSEAERNKSRLISFAHAIEQWTERQPSILLVDGVEFLRLALPTQEAILKKLSRHLTFVATNRLDRLLMNNPFDGILVGTGVRIGMVLPNARELDDTMRQSAKAVFRSEQHSSRGRVENTADFGDMEEGIL